MTRAVSAAVGLVAILLGATLLTGCRSEITPDTAVEHDVTGRVVGPDGSALSDVRIAFHPTGGTAIANAFTLKSDGTFSGKLRGGSYSYYVTAVVVGEKETEKSKAVLSKLPESYKTTSLDRQVKVSGGELDLKF